MPKKLDDAFEIYRTLELCCREAMDSVMRNPDPFSRKFAEATGTTGQRKGDLRSFFQDFFTNQVTPTLLEICFLDVVRTFEFMVYELIKSASGNLQSMLSGQQFAKCVKAAKFPFQSYADKFVKEKWEDDENPGDLRNLGDVKQILKGRLDSRLYEELVAIVEYRNWLAHGSRSKRPRHPGSLQDVVKVLSNILTEIKA